MTVLVSTHYMDEAERCHRITYVSAGQVVVSGTVDQVLARAGLATFAVTGGDIDAAERALTGADGVDQVAPFGATLHVVGQDAARLRAAVERVAGDTGSTARPAETRLEDAFVHFMRTGRQ